MCLNFIYELIHSIISQICWWVSALYQALCPGLGCRGACGHLSQSLLWSAELQWDRKCHRVLAVGCAWSYWGLEDSADTEGWSTVGQAKEGGNLRRDTGRKALRACWRGTHSRNCEKGSWVPLVFTLQLFPCSCYLRTSDIRKAKPSQS